MSTEQPKWPAVGSIVSFVATVESMALGLPDFDRTKKVALFIGTVTGCNPMAPHGIGRVPTACVTVRGRKTNKSVSLDGAKHYLAEHASFEEAERRPFPLTPT